MFDAYDCKIMFYKCDLFEEPSFALYISLDNESIQHSIPTNNALGALANRQTCKMSFYKNILVPNFTPKMCKSQFISFHDKTHKSFFCDNSICHCWLGLVHQIGIFLSIWENSACGKTVSLKWVVFLRYPMSEACMYITCK